MIGSSDPSSEPPATLISHTPSFQATSLHKRLTKQLKEYRDNGWDIIEQTKSQVDAFRKALPLIMDLKNVALRTRHWEEIRALIGRLVRGRRLFGWGLKREGVAALERHLLVCNACDHYLIRCSLAVYS